MIYDINLKPVIGDSERTVRPVLAESRLSGRSQRNIAVTLEALQALYAGEGGAGLGDLTADADPKLDRLMRKAFRLTLATAQSIDGPVEESAADPDRRPPVKTQLQQCDSKVFVETAGYAGAAGCFHYISGV